MKQQDQMYARDLYINQGRTQTQILQIISVDRKTLYTWIKTGSWEEMKLARKQAPAIIVQDIYNHIDAINKKIADRDPVYPVPNPDEVLMLSRLIAVARSQEQASIGFYVQAYDELANALTGEYPAMSKAVTDCADNIIKDMIKGKKFYTKEQDPEKNTQTPA